jgi:hypothetical protein
VPRSCCCAGREDRRIQDFFIEQAFPPKDRVDRVLERIEDGATTQQLMAPSTSARAGSRPCSRCSTSRAR